MDEIFDESGNDLQLSSNEYNRQNESIKKSAMVEGMEEGKRKTIQDGFDQGYELAMNYIQKVNIIKGYLSVMLKDEQNERSDQILNEICQLEKIICNLCEDNFDQSQEIELSRTYKKVEEIFTSRYPNKNFFNE